MNRRLVWSKEWGEVSCIYLALLSLLPLLCSPALAVEVVLDSDLDPQGAIYVNQPPDVPQDVLDQMELVDVRYYGLDGEIHQGQVVIHKSLARDIREVFAVILQTRFPVESVLPIAHPEIQKKGPYGLSPDTNNTSGYVWRPMVGAGKVSLHGLGLAIDINPRRNPYVKGELVLPPDAVYAPDMPGTLTPDSPVVQAFKDLGWKWGGDWGARGKVDYMHFEKVPAGLEAWVRGYRE